jgi:putative acetyltransferase
MHLPVTIRRERVGDEEAIGAIIRQAFHGKAYADGNEDMLVDALRSRGALAVSLVAELGDELIGQIVFSPAMATDSSSGWFTLGPLSVRPEYQGQGVGAMLVEAGLAAITALGASGCILTGDPGYYSRFGFHVSPSNAPGNEPPEYFMIKLLAAAEVHGPVNFHEVFHGAA